MVERRIQEGRSVPETKTRVLETTLAELGVDASFDNLNLARDNLTLMVSRDEQSMAAINLGFFHHPFSGEHTAQLLNMPAPFKHGGRGGILADLNLPVNAKREMRLGKGIRDSQTVHRHIRHLRDPEIGPFYKNFIAQHVNSWIRNVGNDASSDVFGNLSKVMFINNKKDFTSQLFSKWREIIPNGYHKENTNLVHMLGRTAMFAYQGGKRFSSFLDTKLQNYNREKYTDLRFDDVLLSNQRREFIKEFLEQLTDEEREEFSIGHVIDWESRVLVDLEGKNIFRGEDAGSAKIEFVDEERIKIGDDEGTAVEVIPHNDIGGGRFDWLAVGYEFSPQYLSTAFYPVLAWRKDGGQRRFLSQKEAMPYLRQLGFPEARRGDVKLGEIEASCFSPKVTKDWKKRMPLKPLRKGDVNVNQSMMGGQMPVWVSLQDHSAQLFSDENGVISKLEDRIASAL